MYCDFRGLCIYIYFCCNICIGIFDIHSCSLLLAGETELTYKCTSNVILCFSLVKLD